MLIESKENNTLLDLPVGLVHYDITEKDLCIVVITIDKLEKRKLRRLVMMTNGLNYYCKF